MFENGSNNMVMPVSPMMGGYGNGFGGMFGGDGAWWLIVLLLAGWGNGGFGNGFGNGMMPYMMGTNTNNDVQRGFDQQAIMSGINSITSNMCNGFANAEASANARQIADMQQGFSYITNLNSNFNSLQSQLAQCCCDNRLATANLNSTILAENCADRAAFSDGVRDILVNQNNNTQRLVDTTNAAVQGVYDKICQLELNAKNEKIAELTAQLATARSEASQNLQTQTLMADNLRQTQAIEQYLNPTPIPAYMVANPNCCYPQQNCGCGA